MVFSYPTRTVKQQELVNNYLPIRGDGNTMATAAVTAICKLSYKWYNDGDVYDNHYTLKGWLNDISYAANWLYENIPETKEVLLSIKTIKTDNEYAELLTKLENIILNESMLNNLDKIAKTSDIYSAKGPFSFDEDLDDKEDDEY